MNVTREYMLVMELQNARSRHGMALSIIIMQNVGGKEEILILDITSKGL